MKKRYVLTLDLKNDPALIQEYEKYHQKVWPEVRKSLFDAGVVEMEIYRWGNRLFMIMEVDESFSFERKAVLDAGNPVVQEWEQLMSTFQQILPDSPSEGKWQLMKNIFSLIG